MKELEQADQFLRKAADEEALLDVALTEPKVTDSIYGFHCQQAAEKLLKALLSAKRVRFQKTHDLQELLTLLEGAGEVLPGALCRVDELTPYAVEWRYDYPPADRSFDRAAARQLVRELRAFVHQKIHRSTA